MEYLDVVNEKDEVVGSAARPEIYAQGLPHRIVHAFLFNSNGELALQKRSATVSYCPLHWCTIVGGHVSQGETYETAIHREMKEEVGIETRLRFIGNILYVDPKRTDFKKFLGIFTGMYDGTFDISPREVDSAGFFSLEEIENMIEQGVLFHPELLFLLKNGYHKL